MNVVHLNQQGILNGSLGDYTEGTVVSFKGRKGKNGKNKAPQGLRRKRSTPKRSDSEREDRLRRVTTSNRLKNKTPKQRNKRKTGPRPESGNSSTGAFLVQILSFGRTTSSQRGSMLET
ncbi:hypothetical protein V6N13_075394 [Hibiscus sabdariffa]